MKFIVDAQLPLRLARDLASFLTDTKWETELAAKRRKKHKRVSNQR